MEYHVVIHEEEERYWADVRELPGCFASGRDLDELKEALIEAIDMCREPGPPRAAGNGSPAPVVGEMTLVYSP